MPDNPFYVPDSAVLYCGDCAPDDAHEVPQPGETDSPSHCDECGALLAQDLTTDGVLYVREAIADYINAAVFTNADGSKRYSGLASALDEWRDYYGTALDAPRLIEVYDNLRERERARISVVLVTGDNRQGETADGSAWTYCYECDSETPQTCEECGAVCDGDAWLCLDGGDIVCTSHVVTVQNARRIADEWKSETVYGRSLALIADTGAVDSLAANAARIEASALDVSIWTRERVNAPADYPLGRYPMALSVRGRHRNELRALADYCDGVRSFTYPRAALAIREHLASGAGNPSMLLARVQGELDAAGLDTE